MLSFLEFVHGKTGRAHLYRGGHGFARPQWVEFRSLLVSLFFLILLFLSASSFSL